MLKKFKIAIVDYGVGNLYSIQKALEKFTSNAFVTEESNEIASADALILPGVGSFKSGVEGLKIRGIVDPIKEFAQKGKPVLGICLGAQLLLDKGYEFGELEGLGIIPGKVVSFPKINDKIPHIGWNAINPKTKNSWSKTVLHSIKAGSNVYFVHSYVLKPSNTKDILTITNYGGKDFCSAVNKDKIYGCQFHPEKSGDIGLAIIKKFVNTI